MLIVTMIVITGMTTIISNVPTFTEAQNKHTHWQVDTIYNIFIYVYIPTHASAVTALRTTYDKNYITLKLERAPSKTNLLMMFDFYLDPTFVHFHTKHQTGSYCTLLRYILYLLTFVSFIYSHFTIQLSIFNNNSYIFFFFPLISFS